MPADKREPLWADSLARQPERDFDDVSVRWEHDEPAAVPKPPRTDEGDRRRVAFGPFLVGLVVLAALAWMVTASPRGGLTVKDVPSAWGDVPMTCRTARLEQDGGAVEVFHCRAVGGGSLPPGTYRSPDSQWTSDITRVDARADVIEITPDGRVDGWAAY